MCGMVWSAAAAPTARCSNCRRGSFISIPPSLVCLFDHLVGTGEQSLWNFEVQRPGGLQVDDEFVLGRRLHRQLAGLLALENAVDVAGRTPELVGEIRSIGEQPTADQDITSKVDGGQSVPSRERNDQVA